MTCSERDPRGPGALPPPAAQHRALSVGPAVQDLVQGRARLRVHSLFPSTLNLRVHGRDFMLALAGPAGTVLPHAVALERPGDFTAWGLEAGSSGWLEDGTIHLRGRTGTVAVDLARARRPPAGPLALINEGGAARRACAGRLAAIQAGLGCHLRLDALEVGCVSATALGRALGRAARNLGTAARNLAACPGGSAPGPQPLHRAVAALVGLGPGLTPSGDDFLCGFLAAAWARRPEPDPGGGLVAALNRAVAASLGATGEISASLLRVAIRGHWPTPLADLARALAGDRSSEALDGLERLCALGGSSGADLATGFLFGLDILPGAA
jgi:hypothetical protein